MELLLVRKKNQTNNQIITSKSVSKIEIPSFEGLVSNTKISYILLL